MHAPALSRRLAARRGSALTLVLLMTLAVAALAMAAIYLSQSAGLLSQFYDRERSHRLAAESALEIVRGRLTRDATIAVPDTGMVVLLSGWQPPVVGGGTVSNVRVNVYAAVTGDTTGTRLPYVSLLAAAYDARGTRHVRRMDLERESFARYQLLVDSFPSDVTYGPAAFAGRVHSNQSFRSEYNAAAPAARNIFDDTLTVAVTSSPFVGTATYLRDTISGVPRVPYPRDSTFPRLDTLANAANLRFAVVTGASGGNVRGTRLEFVAFDANNDGAVGSGEGFARVFDLASGQDTSRLRVSFGPAGNRCFTFIFSWCNYLDGGLEWDDVIIQNQCGAFYYRDSKWQFFPVATHRALWAQGIIQREGATDYPSVSTTAMSIMADMDEDAAERILRQPTARCFPAGSPYLMPTERMSRHNSCGAAPADNQSAPWQTATSGCTDAANYYGGQDTTFTITPRTCTIGSNGRCGSNNSTVLGSWRAFSGTAVTGIASSIRQGTELPYLWPLSTERNAGYRGVMRATGGPLFISGTVRGNVTLVVGGAAYIVGPLRMANHPLDAGTATCESQLGLVATGDILAADNALLRRKSLVAPGAFLTAPSALVTRQFGSTVDIEIHAQLMSLTGTVGIENPTLRGASGMSCQDPWTTTTVSGCFRLVGGAAMRRASPLWDTSLPAWSTTPTGVRFDGTPDPCQRTSRRPPFFPLTNRYRLVRAVEMVPAQVNTPAKVRTALMRLKGQV